MSASRAATSALCLLRNIGPGEVNPEEGASIMAVTTDRIGRTHPFLDGRAKAVWIETA